jgi:hypothetical protein
MRACIAALATLLVMACAPSRPQAANNTRDAMPDTSRQAMLDTLARSYFPGRTGQLVIVPREGDIITRPEPEVVYIHGSPRPYDVDIPVLFAGPA